MKMRNSIPAEAVSIYNRALNMSSKGDFKPALDEYNRAISVHPRFIEAYNNIGEIYSKMGNSDKAISTYLHALSIERNYRVLLNLGVEYYNKGQITSALAHFSESLKEKDDFQEGHFYSGMAYFNIKDFSNAEKHFIRVVDNDRKHLKANTLLSYIYYTWKQYCSVIECLDRICDIADDISFVNKYYGFCNYFLGNYDKAVSYLTIALESNPKYEKFKTYLKNLTVESKLLEIGDIDECIKELEARMISETPAVSELSRLSLLYVFKGQYRKAETLLTGRIQ
jgi:tetratricopeptide (TPR) repeat protein